MFTPNQKQMLRFAGIFALAMAAMFVGCLWLALAMPIDRTDRDGFSPGDACYEMPTDSCLEGSGGYVPADLPLTPIEKMSQA